MLAVHLGGGESDLSNYATLCTPCHAKKTATEGTRSRYVYSLLKMRAHCTCSRTLHIIQVQDVLTLCKSSLLTAHRSPLTAHFSPLTTHCLWLELLIAHCSLVTLICSPTYLFPNLSIHRWFLHNLHIS